MPGKCRICGCTDERGCPAGCEWIEPDLCSVCHWLIEEYAGYLHHSHAVSRAGLMRIYAEALKRAGVPA